MLIFFKRKRKKKLLTESEVMRRSYLIGLAVGLAGLYWIYLLACIIPFFPLIFGPVKPMKSAYMALLGLATPFWVYLPYYLYVTL